MLVLFRVASLPDFRENSWNPIIGNLVHHTIHFLILNGFWVHSHELMLDAKVSESSGQAVHDGGLT
jgi:hypothetical protein